MLSKTINEWLVIKKVLGERKGDMKQIRLATSMKTKTTRRYEGETKDESIEPEYDTKLLDRRVTEIQNAELLIDAAVKQSNALTSLEINVDTEKLLAPMD